MWTLNRNALQLWYSDHVLPACDAIPFAAILILSLCLQPQYLSVGLIFAEPYTFSRESEAVFLAMPNGKLNVFFFLFVSLQQVSDATPNKVGENRLWELDQVLNVSVLRA